MEDEVLEVSPTGEITPPPRITVLVRGRWITKPNPAYAERKRPSLSETIKHLVGQHDQATHAGLIVEDENTGYHHGQTDNVLIAKTPDGKLAATLEYAVFEKKPHIQMVRAHQPGLRAGEHLVDKLAQKYGYENISWGMMTPDGTKLRDRLDQKYGVERGVDANDPEVVATSLGGTVLSRSGETAYVEFDNQESADKYAEWLASFGPEYADYIDRQAWNGKFWVDGKNPQNVEFVRVRKHANHDQKTHGNPSLGQTLTRQQMLDFIMSRNAPEQVKAGMTPDEWASQYVSDEDQEYRVVEIDPRLLSAPIRAGDQEHVRKLAASEAEFDPIVLDSNSKIQARYQGGKLDQAFGLQEHTVLDGKHRTEAARTRGDKTIRAIVPTRHVEKLMRQTADLELMDFIQAYADRKGWKVTASDSQSLTVLSPQGKRRLDKYDALKIGRNTQHRFRFWDEQGKLRSG